MNKNPKINYADVSLVKIFRNTKNNYMLVIVYNNNSSLYYKFREENLSNIFNGESIAMREESDFEYDDKGASDKESRDELDKLISWCDFTEEVI